MKIRLIWLNTILVLLTLSSCDTSKSPNDSSQFTISGDQSGQDTPSGSTGCDPSKKVRIQVHISGGAAGNTLAVNAFCGGVLVGTTIATDPGNGTAGSKLTSSAQAQGLGTCTPGTTASPNWSYICDFNT